MQLGTKYGSKIIVLGSSGTKQYCSWLYLDITWQMHSDEHWKPSYTTSTHVRCMHMHAHTHSLTSLHCDMVLAARCSSSALGQSSCSFLPPSTWVIPLRSSTRDVRRWTGHKSVCCVWVLSVCVSEWEGERERERIIYYESDCVCVRVRECMCASWKMHLQVRRLLARELINSIIWATWPEANSGILKHRMASRQRFSFLLQLSTVLLLHRILQRQRRCVCNHGHFATIR